VHRQLRLRPAGILSTKAKVFLLVSVLTLFCIAAAHSTESGAVSACLEERGPVTVCPVEGMRGRALEHTGGWVTLVRDRCTCGAGGSASKQLHSNLPSGAATAVPTLLLGFTRMQATSNSYGGGGGQKIQPKAVGMVC
jgi:hypothetical protein